MTKVVIIGASYGGVSCAKGLKGIKSIDMTIVDMRTHTIGKWAGCRAATLGDEFSHRVCMPNDSIYNSRTINKKVVSIDSASNKITFADGTDLEYEILVCATGACNISPVEPPIEALHLKEQTEYYEAVASKIKAAGRITILGSGAVGTELAGDLACEYPDKEIAILSRGKNLCSGLNPPVPQKFSDRLRQLCEQQKIKLFLGQSTDSFSMEDFDEHRCLVGTRELTLTSGEKYTTDLVLRCTGFARNNDLYPKDWLDEYGRLKVTENLLIPGTENVFGIGDVTDLNESKQGHLARKHGVLTAKNIIAMSKGGKPNNKYVPKSDSTSIVVPFGRNHGAASMNGWIIGSWMVSFMKGKDVDASVIWKAAGKANLMLKAGDKEWKAKRGLL